MVGSVILLTMTELPDRGTPHFLGAELLVLKQAPHRVGDGAAVDDGAIDNAVRGMGSTPMAVTLYPLPDGFSSMAFTALDPMSSPIKLLVWRKNN